MIGFGSGAKGQDDACHAFGQIALVLVLHVVPSRQSWILRLAPESSITADYPPAPSSICGDDPARLDDSVEPTLTVIRVDVAAARIPVPVAGPRCDGTHDRPTRAFELAGPPEPSRAVRRTLSATSTGIRAAATSTQTVQEMNSGLPTTRDRPVPPRVSQQFGKCYGETP